MRIKQEYTRELAQADLEDVGQPWAKEHASRPGSDIIFIASNPGKNFWQDVDENITPAIPPQETIREKITTILPDWVPDKYVDKIADNVPEEAIHLYLHYRLAKSMGRNALMGWGLANKLKDDFQKVSQELQSRVDGGENILIALAHQDLKDPGFALGGALRSTKRLSYITDTNYVVLSPTMKFEGFNGQSLVDWLRPAANIVWTWPLTPSAGKRDIPHRLRARMARGLSEELSPIMDDPEKGTITYAALGGSAMLAIRENDDENGKTVGWEFPEVYPRAANALQSINHVLPFAFYRDPNTGKVSWEVGDFIGRDSLLGVSETDINKQYMDRVMFDLRRRMQRLANVPVKYSSLSDKNEADLAQAS